MLYIPKVDGKQCPLGIAALEDKIVQQAVVTVLAPIYEATFLGFSYGFRPGRNQHQALDAVVVGMQAKRVSWVLDADIKAFFDTVDHVWLLRFLEHRIGDRRVLRLILDPAAAQIELTEGGKRALLLPGSEQGTWLEDVDTVTLTGWCESPSAVRIEFGRCVGTVRSAQPRQAATSSRLNCLRPFAARSTGAESMLGPLAHRQCPLRGWLETLCTLCLKHC